MRRAAALALCAALSAASRPSAGETVGASEPVARRGPIESRDEWLLVQDHLSLTAASPDPVGRGRTRLRLAFDWGSDFGWSQQPRGETPIDRRFLVDGEHRTLAVELQRGLSDAVSLGIRVPVQWRGGGILDGIIDWFHRAITKPLGLPDNGRPVFLRDQFRVLGRDDGMHPVAWTAQPGTGLGRIELSSSWTLRPAPERSGWTTALGARLSLPTGTGPFQPEGVDGGLQLAAAHPLGRRWDAYLGAGGVAFSDREGQGIRYAAARVHGFAGLEWRPARRLSLLVQTDGTSRLVTNLARYPGLQSYLRIGGKLDLTARLVLEGGFSENLARQEATTDFGIFLGVSRRFGPAR